MARTKAVRSGPVFASLAKAHEDRREDGEVDRSGNPSPAPLRVPRPIEPEVLGVPPGDVLRVSEERRGPHPTVGPGLVEANPVARDEAVIDLGLNRGGQAELMTREDVANLDTPGSVVVMSGCSSAAAGARANLEAEGALKSVFP